MRRYDDPVEVRRGGAGGDEPEQFLWRGRLWKVRAVLARWVETGAWWQSEGVRAAIGTDEPAEASGSAEPTGQVVVLGDLLGERELWRVLAGRGGLESDGVFDLSFDWSDGHWQLVGCVD